MADDDQPAPEQESDAEVRKAQLGLSQAIYVDTSFILWWSGHLRLTLGEKVGGKTHWRATALMEIETAEALVANINKVLGKLAQKEKQEVEDEGAAGEEKDS